MIDSCSCTKQVPKTEDKIGTVTRARLNFMNDFFSEENEFNVGTILSFDKSDYTLVAIKTGGLTAMDIIGNLADEEIDFGNLDDYFPYFYRKGVSEVQYFTSISNEEIQAILKAILVYKKLDIYELSSRKLTFMPNMYGNRYSEFCWFSNDVSSGLKSNYLRLVRDTYNKIMENAVDIPDLERMYLYFKENPNPGMKVLRLEDACHKIMI